MTSLGEMKYTALDAHKHWGNTSPCLRIAKAWGVDYAVPLHVVDFYLRGTPIPADISKAAVHLSFAFTDACRGVATMMAYQQRGGVL